MVALKSSIYIFGGSPRTKIGGIITTFDTTTKQWIRLGKLNQARYAHAVIVHQGQFVVVGGDGSLGTERCALKGNSVQCTTVDPELENYYFYPEMMSVSENFCPKFSDVEIQNLAAPWSKCWTRFC